MKRWGLALVAFGVAACGGAIAPEEPTTRSSPNPSTNAPSPPPTTSASPRPPSSSAPLPVPAPTIDAPILACGGYELSPSDVLARFGSVGRVGLFRVAQVAEECTGLGGMHAILAFEEGCRDPRGAIHVGGHGCHEVMQVGDLVVAAFDDTVQAFSAAVCLGDLDPTVGTARGYVLVASKQDGAALLAKSGCAP